MAQGTNSLLQEGAAAITGTDDVLDELFGVGRAPGAGARAAPRSAPADPLLRAVLSAADGCASVEAIARTTGRTAAQTRAALGRLEADGYLVRRDLGGWERAAC